MKASIRLSPIGVGFSVYVSNAVDAHTRRFCDRQKTSEKAWSRTDGLRWCEHHCRSALKSKARALGTCD